MGKCHGGKRKVKKMAIASAKVNAKQSSDRHPEGIFHKHAGMLCCTACSAPIDFEQKQSVTNILRVLRKNRSCEMLNLHWQSQAQRAASKLLPILTAPQNKFSDLQRLFTLLVTGDPAMEKYLETSFAKPQRYILFESTGGKKKAKNFENRMNDPRKLLNARVGHRLAADEESSLAAAALSTVVAPRCSLMDDSQGLGEGSRQFTTGISSNAGSLVRNQKSNPGRWKQFRSMIFLLRRQQLLLAISLRAQQERGRKALFLNIVHVACTKPLLSLVGGKWS